VRSTTHTRTFYKMRAEIVKNEDFPRYILLIRPSFVFSRDSSGGLFLCVFLPSSPCGKKGHPLARSVSCSDLPADLAAAVRGHNQKQKVDVRFTVPAVTPTARGLHETRSLTTSYSDYPLRPRAAAVGRGSCSSWARSRTV